MQPAQMLPRAKRPPPKKQQPPDENRVVLAGVFDPTTGVWGGQWAMTAQELNAPAKSSVFHFHRTKSSAGAAGQPLLPSCGGWFEMKPQPLARRSFMYTCSVRCTRDL